LPSAVLVVVRLHSSKGSPATIWCRINQPLSRSYSLAGSSSSSASVRLASHYLCRINNCCLRSAHVVVVSDPKCKRRQPLSGAGSVIAVFASPNVVVLFDSASCVSVASYYLVQDQCALRSIVVLRSLQTVSVASHYLA
jgi:hypothetical protein